MRVGKYDAEQSKREDNFYYSKFYTCSCEVEDAPLLVMLLLPLGPPTVIISVILLLL